VISGFFLRAKQILTKQKARYGEQTIQYLLGEMKMQRRVAYDEKIITE
jgi:hypothetical protein